MDSRASKSAQVDVGRRAYDRRREAQTHAPRLGRGCARDVRERASARP
ncbi:hypothetical protein SEA_SUNFLOWER1121_45 [Mycobacterium Phage Sunflower1121]|nr:hypothetical protein SEA_SUNFLOWER1121_45 [Mycobacterium Phage Sunflower1121]